MSGVFICATMVFQQSLVGWWLDGGEVNYGRKTPFLPKCPKIPLKNDCVLLMILYHLGWSVKKKYTFLEQKTYPPWVCYVSCSKRILRGRCLRAACVKARNNYPVATLCPKTRVWVHYKVFLTKSASTLKSWSQIRVSCHVLSVKRLPCQEPCLEVCL